MLSNTKKLLGTPLLASLLVLLLPALAGASEWRLNMTQGVTEVSQEVYSLHMIIFWICTVIGVVVFGAMFYTMIMHRKSKGAKAANFHHSTQVEIIWTVIPSLILIAMAVPATSTLKKIYDTDDADMSVLVTGYQWKWKYEYLGEDLSFFSNLSTPQSQIYEGEARGENYLLEVDNPLVIPAGKKVKFLVTAQDVIHSWWVPDLAVKRDAIPGYVHEAWTRVDKEGIYRGQCAELCGKDHGFMPIEVHVRSQSDYNEWLTQEKAKAAEIAALTQKTFSFDELMAEGEAVYQRACAACHGPGGEGGVGPAIIKSKVATGPIDIHIDVIVNGITGTMMQAFGEQLNEVEAAAVITYQRNGFNNNMGDEIQPIDVYNFKQGN